MGPRPGAMESFLNRYRNITVLLLVILAQLVLLAVQVKNDQDVRLIRVWTVTFVTPLARVAESVRATGLGFLNNYVLLHDARQENRALRSELDKLKMENHFLNSELRTADRVKALSVFQSRTPSRTLAARIIGAGAGTNSKAVFVDRGSVAGVMRGMAVVTPDGIAGKVIAAYPTASEVMLVTDSEFAAGVVSQKNEIRGTLKGQGYAICKVDYVPPEQKVEVGEMFYTSGDDRIFPKGFPVGQVKVVRNASPFKEILVEPAALRRGLEEVLVLLQGVHQEIPEATAVLAMAPVYIAPAPPPDPKAAPVPAVPASAVGTDADRLRARYQAIGEAQKHVFGGGSPWAPPPNFNLKPPAGGAAPPAAPKPASSATPASGAPRTAAGAPPAASTPSKPPAPKPTAPNASGTPPATASAPPAAPPTPAPAAKPKPPAPGDPL